MQMEDTRDSDCDIHNLGTGACCVIVAVNVHRMNFFLAFGA